MSQYRIANISVETFLYEDTRTPVNLVRLDELPAMERNARRRMREDCGLRSEGNDEQLFLWTPRPKQKNPRLTVQLLEHRRLKEQLGKNAEGMPAPRRVDVIGVRDEFLKIVTPEQGLSFFTNYGIFSEENRGGLPSLQGLSFADLLAWQHLVRQCWLQIPATWENIVQEHSQLRAVREVLGVPEFSLAIEPYLHLRLRAECVREAILGAIYLEKLENIKSRLCKRPDCDVVFNLKSRHEREYCSPACAHLVAVRKSRQRLTSTKTGKGRRPPKSSRGK
jgi:hypothetical protein